MLIFGEEFKVYIPYIAYFLPSFSPLEYGSLSKGGYPS